jgi:ribose transport system ATP-binding protein
MGSSDLLRIEGLAATFGPRTVLNVDHFTLGRGRVRALVGANGSGKSTFVKLLAGYYRPDALPRAQCVLDGDDIDLYAPAVTHPRRGVAFVHQDLGLVPSMTVHENFFVRPRRRGLPGLVTLHRRAERQVVAIALAEVGVDASVIDQTVDQLPLSICVLVAVARAKAGAGEVKLMVLDEPTAHVPNRDVAIIAAGMRVVVRSGGSVIYISHRMGEVFSTCDEITVLRDGYPVLTAATSDVDEREVLDAMVGTARAVVDLSARADFPVARVTDPDPSSEPGCVAGSGLSVQDVGGSELTSLSLTVRPGEIVGIIGLAGSGLDEVAPIVVGASPRAHGTVSVGSTSCRSDIASTLDAGIVYIPGDRSLASFNNLDLSENLGIANLRPFLMAGWLSTRREHRLIADDLKTFGVRPPDPTMLMRKLSGGNQQKVLLGRWLRRDIKVLVLEQPTQGVDVHARESLYAEFRAQAAKGRSVLVISTDEDELCALCVRVHVLTSGTVTSVIEKPDLSVPNLVAACHKYERVEDHDTGGIG